jgi:hypothetical protein
MAIQLIINDEVILVLLMLLAAHLIGAAFKHLFVIDILKILYELTHDHPAHAKDVTNVEDNDHEFTYFQKVFPFQDLFDGVAVD